MSDSPAAPASSPPPVPVRPLRLEIKPVIQTAENVARKIQLELPSHDGLAGAAASVLAAARQAREVSIKMQRPWSLHRLPAWFLALALLALGGWVYWRFFYVAQLTIAVPDRDATALREKIANHGTVEFLQKKVPGSREAVEQVTRGEVDVAFMQGGMKIPNDLPRRESPSPELVLWMVRDGRSGLSDVKTILTSDPGQGSHTVGMQFLETWRVKQKITWVHEWRTLTANVATYKIPDSVDAVFVVKDPADEQTLLAVHRLTTAGFHLRSPDLGVRVANLPYLMPSTIPPAFLEPDPAIPDHTVATYAVKTYLIARKGLTPRLLSEAARLLDTAQVAEIDEMGRLNVADASEIFQGVEAFLGILVNIGLAFLALLGLEMMTYRQRFHELNSIVSLLSMLQSNKDVLGLTDPRRRAENLLYLSLCSDLLGLISMISGYYTQENTGLLSNSLSEIVHQRCDGLKINIQLKILHAGINVPADVRGP